MKRVCSQDYFSLDSGLRYFVHPPLDEGGKGREWIGSDRRLFLFPVVVMFLVLFVYRFSFLLCLLIFFSSNDAVILLVCQNALRKVRVSKKRTIALCDLRSVTLFSSESLWNHSFTTVLVLPPLLRSHFFYIFVCMVLFNFFCFRSSLFPRYFFPRAIVRTVRLPQDLKWLSVQPYRLRFPFRVTREKSRAAATE